MGVETILFSSKERSSRSDTGAFLRTLAGRIDSGQVILRRASEETVLDMPAQLVLQIKAEDEDKRSKGTQHSLKIELKWYDEGAASGPVELG